MEIDEEPFLNNTELFIQEDPASKLGLMAAKIAYHNFEWRFITLVMFNTVQAIGLQTFLKYYNQTVVVKLGWTLPRHRVAVPQIVIFGEESAEISRTIRWLIRVKYDSNSKFIIICAAHDQECDEQKIFQTLREAFILNVVVLKNTHHRLNKERSAAYSYRIVLPGKCLNHVPYRIDLKSDCQNDKCFTGLYPERLSNFHKCRLIMSTVEQPPFMYLHDRMKDPTGTDGDIMKLAASMLNATLVLIPPRDGAGWGYYSNNNWTGSLGDVYNGFVHASVCTAPLTSNKYGNFQISFTYYSMDIVWAAKLPTENASWEKLLHPLNFHVRVVLFFAFMCIIVINTLRDTKMWEKFRKAFQMGPPKNNMLFYSWLLFLGMPISRIPRNKSLRITLFTWIWCCFILRSAYQAALITSLKHHTYPENLESFQDALKSGYPYGGLVSLRDYYSDDRDIYDNWVTVEFDNVYKTLDQMLDEKTNFVLASNKEIIKHHLMKYNGTKQLQIIPEKIVNSPTVVYFKKFSPLTAPLSYTLRVAFEAGFVDHFYGKYFDHDRNLLRRYQTAKFEPLNMYNFAGCFAVLIIGWFIASIYFAVEIICGNLDEKV